MSTTQESIALYLAQHEVPIADELHVELRRLVGVKQTGGKVDQLFFDEITGALRRVALRLQAAAMVSVERTQPCCDCGGYPQTDGGVHEFWCRSLPHKPGGMTMVTDEQLKRAVSNRPAAYPTYDPDDYRDLLQAGGA